MNSLLLKKTSKCVREGTAILSPLSMEGNKIQQYFFVLLKIYFIQKKSSTIELKLSTVCCQTGTFLTYIIFLIQAANSKKPVNQDHIPESGTVPQTFAEM